MSDSLALVIGNGPARRVEVRRSIKAPIQRVWEAITDANEISSWWQPATFEKREGGRVRVFMDAGGDPFVDGIVKVFQPPYLLEFSWNEADDKPGLVRFDLVEESSDQTIVTFTQFVPVSEVIPAAAGWHDIVDRLASFLQTGAPGEGRFSELMEIYKDACVS